MNQDPLRRAFTADARVAARGTGCPGAETLWASARGELGSGEDEGVIEHLAACGACGVAWRMARAMDERPAGTIASRGLPVAIAASLILAVGALALWNRPGEVRPPSLRTQQADWLRPADGLAALHRADPVLRWAAGPEGSIYDVRVTTEDLEAVGNGWRLQEPEYHLEPSAVVALPDGASVHWQVTAHLPDGRKIESATFTTPVR